MSRPRPDGEEEGEAADSAGSSPRSGGPAAPLQDVCVLLVDDDEGWARATARLLEANRDAFAVETAHSLEAGRRRFAELDPDCVVCDYRLGDGDGLAMLEAVRAADRDRPFVLVTGRGSESVASRAIGRGVTDYIRKDRDDDQADLLASRVSNAVRSYRVERTLERERQGKNAMLDILTATTARGDLSQQFCTQLVEGRGYECAWIGTAAGPGEVVPEASAGRDGYLDEPAVPTASGEAEPPWAATLDGDDPVVVELADPGSADADAPWRAAAAEYGFDRAAAFPVRHDGVRFGVLVVFASGSRPIDAGERRFLAEYAETVGYALRTAEWKRSLLAEEPVRIGIEVADRTAPLVAFAAGADRGARVEVVSAIDRGDGTTLYLARVEGLSVEDVRERARATDSLSVVDVDADASPIQCELVADSPTPETVLADHGARLDRTVVEHGTATVSALVADDGRVSTLATALGEMYDASEVSTIWTDRTGETERAGEDPLASLTDRQLEVVRHAFHDGYFEDPRGTSATELAESLGVARATLTQHLRTAQRKVLTRLLGR